MTVAVTRMRPRGCWGISRYRAATRFHLIASAEARWYTNGPRCFARFACGDAATDVALHIQPPEYGELCDHCALADVIKPVVYRLYDAAAKTIYIGCSKNFIARLRSHANSPKSAELWAQVRSWSFVEYDDIDLAYRAEAVEISREQPQFNTDYTDRRVRGRKPVAA